MISEKIRSQIGGEMVIRQMFEKGIKMKQEFGADNVFDFSLGNPNVPAPEKVKEAVTDIITNLPPQKVHSYMPNAGFPEVRKAVADHLNSRYGTEYTPDNIIMTAGAGSAINLVLKSILDIGDEVVCLAPYFAEYKGYIQNYYADVVEVGPKEDGSFYPDTEKLAAAITPKTKAVMVDKPNNPTGVVYPEKVIKEIAEVLRKKEEEFGTVIYLISDEPYREVVYIDHEGELPWLPDYYDDTIVTYSYSKALSLPGERIGEVIVPDSADGSKELIGAITTCNLLTGTVNAPSLIQLAVARCLDEKADVEFYKKNAELLYEIVTEAGFEALEPQGAFYLWMKAPNGDDNAFTDLAAEHKILVVPGSAFAGPGYVRLSFCVAHHMIERSRQAFMELGKDAL
jgi:aspartate aminotransferase